MKLGYAVAALALATAPAMAASTTVQELLDDGFTIVAAEVLPIEVVKRAMNENWVDDYFMTLQKENRIAFCHIALSSTTDASSFGGVACTVSDPAGTTSTTKPQPRLPKPPQ